jgi:hypothetical protein
MLHRNRRHVVEDVAAEDGQSPIEVLARKLTETTWCCCNGFRLEGYLFLNDATGGDGAQEYAVVKEGPEPVQVESITFGWCAYDKAVHYIERTVRGDFDDQARPVSVRLETPADHGRCVHCA